MAKYYDLTDIVPSFKRLFTGIYRTLRVRKYKEIKIVQSKLLPERDYKIFFKMGISDLKNPQESDIYEIVIPAKAFDSAKRKLKDHVYEKFFIEVVDFEINKNEELETNENTHYFN
jgi:hypothetical protein